MKTSLGPRIRIALVALLFGAIAVTAWSCACSTAAHGTVAASGSSTTDDSMGLGSNVGSEVGSAASSGSDTGSGSGTASGTDAGSASHSSAPGRGEQCGPNDACGQGVNCVHYYGVAGPRGPQLSSCETPCKDDPNICNASGTKCVNIADGPGQVCR